MAESVIGPEKAQTSNTSSPYERVVGLARQLIGAELRQASTEAVGRIHQKYVDAVADLASVAKPTRDQHRQEVETKDKKGTTVKRRVNFRQLESIGEIFSGLKNRRDITEKVFESLLGDYDQSSGEFTGGLEAYSEGVQKTNSEYLSVSRRNGKLGYGDYGQIMRTLVDDLFPKIHVMDTEFARINNGSSKIDVDNIGPSRERRLKWVQKTFGLKNMDGFEEHWTSALEARKKLNTGTEEGRKEWEKFVQKLNQEASRTQQIIILGLIQVTQAQGVDDFLMDGPLTNTDGERVRSLSLTGARLTSLTQQYQAVVEEFIDSESDNGTLRYDSGRGLLFEQIALRDRAIIRDALDRTIGYGGQLIEGKHTVWDEIVARAKFEEAYNNRYRGRVNVAQRIKEGRLDRAQFNEVASGQIIRNEWFERIPGFSQAVARYSTEGESSLAYDNLMTQAVASGDEKLIRRLQRADRYARQFLEMAGAPVDGFKNGRDYTYIQIWNPVLGPDSGMLALRLEGKLEDALTKSLRDKKFSAVRRRFDNGEEEIVIKIDGASGEFITPIKNGEPTDAEFFDPGQLKERLRKKGRYVDSGYWPEMEGVWGEAFTFIPKDYFEMCGRLSRTNLDNYHQREMGRRAGEAWDGSENHKRVFISFLLERKQALGEINRGLPYVDPVTGGSFDPQNDDHLIDVASQLGIRYSTTEDLVNSLSNPDTWGLYFDPTNLSHLDRISSSKKEQGFDRYWINVMWAFDSATHLRRATKLMDDLVAHGVVYEQGGIWKGTTVEKIDELINEYWLHAKPWEAFESLASVYQAVNEAMDEEIVQAIERKNEVTHTHLSQMFERGFWRTATLTKKEREEVIKTGTLNGREVPKLTNEEVRQGKTMIGKAMEMKGEAKRARLRVLQNQSLYRYLLEQRSGIEQGHIIQQVAREQMLYFALPDLTEGDLRRVYANPDVFYQTNYTDGSYELIGPEDPRYMKIFDRVLASLYVFPSDRILSELHRQANDSRDYNWNVLNNLGNEGTRAERIEVLMGLSTISSIGEQALRKAASLRQNFGSGQAWQLFRGKEYAFLDETAVRFAEMYYGFDIRDKEEVDRRGGQAFIDQFNRIMDYPEMVVFMTTGIRLWDNKASVFKDYVDTVLGSFTKQVEDYNKTDKSKEINRPDFWENIPQIVVPGVGVAAPEITYLMVAEKLSELHLREPLYGKWLHLHVGLDVGKIEYISGLNFATPEIGFAKNAEEILGYMMALADCPDPNNLSYRLEQKFLPIIESYYLTYRQQFTTETGEVVILRPDNIRRYLPQITKQFKSEMTGKTPGTYNFEAMEKFFYFYYGVDFGNEIGDLNKIKAKLARNLNFASGPADKGRGFRGYIDHLRDEIKLMNEHIDQSTGAFVPNVKGKGAELYPMTDVEFFTRHAYLRNLLNSLQHSYEGPSEVQQLVRLVQDRNAGWWGALIEERKTEIMLMSDAAKLKMVEGEILPKGNEEVVLLANDHMKEQVAHVYEFLETTMGLPEDEIAQLAGLKELKTIWDLREMLFEPNKRELGMKAYHFVVNQNIDPIGGLIFGIATTFIKSEGLAKIHAFQQKWFAPTLPVWVGGTIISVVGAQAVGLGLASVSGNASVVYQTLGGLLNGGLSVGAFWASAVGISALLSNYFVLSPLYHGLVTPTIDKVLMRRAGLHPAKRQELLSESH